ncbi:MAG: gfo/Idh/MocA family oxidoreductase, partial [Candidatus Hydrogenedentes bacterium]|nr:gfo/Idh/MocA family oxidoreductase [Candidatus Hydrogenedentota bacterium]
RDWHAEKACVNSLLVQEGADALAVLQRICQSSARAVTAMGALAVLRHDSEVCDEPAPSPGVMGQWPLVSQRGLNEVVDVEDISMVSMCFGNGKLASYQQCHFTPDNWHNFTVIGTRGRMENFGEDPDGAVIRVWNRPMPYYNPWGDEQHTIPRDETIRSEDGRMMADFLRFLRSDSPSLEGAVEARNAVAAADLATRSIRNGGACCELPVLTHG